jgi:hypothetical protein
MAEFPAPTEGIAITHFIVAKDVDRSRRFYSEVLGDETVLNGEFSIVASGSRGVQLRCSRARHLSCVELMGSYVPLGSQKSGKSLLDLFSSI